MESRRNGPQLSSRHDDDDDDGVQPPKNYLLASLAVIFVPPTLKIVAVN